MIRQEIIAAEEVVRRSTVRRHCYTCTDHTVSPQLQPPLPLSFMPDLTTVILNKYSVVQHVKPLATVKQVSAVADEHAMRCITANVLHTKGRCDKLVPN